MARKGNISLIQGVGMDLTSVSRMARSIEKEHFVQRVFGEEEQRLFAQRGSRAAQSAAANFAAKEAFLKAADTGLGGFALRDIQALRQESGAPVYCFSGAALEYMQTNRLTAHLSLSHEGDMAAAVCILERLPHNA